MLREFCGLSYEELVDWCSKQGSPAYVAKQLFDWVYTKKVTSFSSMSNLKKTFRETLEKTFRLPSLQLSRVLQTEEAVKCLWELHDGHKVESVLLFSPGRNTVCISSQVGCNARCAFCASGKQGWKRHLTRAEIIEQVVLAAQMLEKEGKKLTHIVFMGMGEPLENFEQVLFALKQITSPQAFGFSMRRITLSTVGIVENIHALADSGLKATLVLSLHAPNQKIRKKIIPYARKYPLEDLLEAMQYYAEKTKRDVTYEYILIDEINAEKEHAKELAELLEGQQCTVNLIPYNPIPGVALRRPGRQKIETFEKELAKRGVRSTRRYTKGTEIAAACGQLALNAPNLEAQNRV
ncbi:MAG: 23S rRNA (adenine(2503)-C(2))-methyltransferase RlmN [Chlamydiota bacterium]